MAETTDFLELVLPGGGSTGLITPPDRVDIDVLNDNFRKINTWAKLIGEREDRLFNFRGPASSIGSVAGMVRGDTYQETDGNFVFWRYDGANWVSNENGAYLIRPASVTNGVINADGSVTANGGAASLSLNGIFSSRFRRYRIDFNFKFAAASNFTMRLRNAGVDDSSANYGGQFHYASAATPGSVSNAGATLWGNFGPSTTSDRFFGELTFVAPGLSGSGENFMKSAYGIVSGVFNQQVLSFSGFLGNKEANTFDGCTFLSGSTFAATASTFRVLAFA